MWRLEKDSTVARASLPHQLGQYLNSIEPLKEIAARAIPATLLIDSLDEARARVSAQSWGEFLDSIAEASESGLRTILFGRDRTLEEVWLTLADSGCSIAWLEVSHFPVESQKNYVDGRVSADGAMTPEAESRYYAQARDAILSALSGSVGDKSAETFVGYAPVLDAVAAVLKDEQNHFKLVQEFSPKAGTSRHLDVLSEILHELLVRDQGKLEPLANELELTASDVYSPTEQIKWLWHDIAGLNEPELSYITDPGTRFEYRKQVRSFLNDHPFRTENRWASAVFEAYATVVRFDKALPAELLLDVGNRSGLLFDLVANKTVNSKMLIDEGQFAALHASLIAGESVGSAASVAAAQQNEEEFEGSMEVSRPSGSLSLCFDLVPKNSSEIVLAGPLESLTLSTPGRIRIPQLESGKAIGPDLFLRCASLQIEGNEARFARTSNATLSDGSDIRIEVTGSSVLVPAMISVEPPEDAFDLAVQPSTHLTYPWTNYRVDLEPEESTDLQSKAVRFLKKLQNLARTHGHDDGRATFYMKLQGRQPIKTTRLRAVLSILEAKGAVRLQGDLVFLTDEANKHRFSGKNAPGQRTIEQEWGYWGPLVRAIEQVIE